MLNPYSLLPLALAARGGRVDDYEVQQLVAAGLTLLQRNAPLVRALSGKRAAILLPASPQFFVALAACEGRGAVLIDPLSGALEISHQLIDARVGAVFTDSTLAAKLPGAVPRVIFDDGIRSARVSIEGATREVDLGSHHGLSIEGDTEVAGSDDEAVVVYSSAAADRATASVLSHNDLLASARATAAAVGNGPGDRVLALLPFSNIFALTVAAIAPLLSGGTVVTMARFDAARALELIGAGDITEVVGDPAVFGALLEAMQTQHARAELGALRLSVCRGEPQAAVLREQWLDATETELRLL